MKSEKDTENTAGGGCSSHELLACMEDELARTIAAYESLVDQSRKLAEAMGYYADHVLGKVMPKTAGERTNTERIVEWFDKEKSGAVEHMMEREAEREKGRERERLLASLKLTPEQMALLGLANTQSTNEGPTK